jgi:DNA-binding response OmpR family regulator
MDQDCILVIEDQEDLAALYETTLELEGYGVRKTHSGEEGVAEFRAHGADLVLLDMTLPEMSGIQVLHEIRQLDPNVPFVILTGVDDERIQEQCASMGVHGYLTKPPDFDHLITTIRTALTTPREDAEIITLRLPLRITSYLRSIDPNLERAITLLVTREFE